MLTSNEKQSNGMKGFLPERIDHKFEETCKHLVHGDRIEVRYFVHDGADGVDSDDSDDQLGPPESKRMKANNEDTKENKKSYENQECVESLELKENSTYDNSQEDSEPSAPIRIWWPCTVHVPKENSKVLRFDYDALNVGGTDFPSEKRRVMLISPRTFIDLDSGRSEDRQVFRLMGEVSPPASLCPTLNEDELSDDEDDPAHTLTEWAEIIDHTIKHHWLANSFSGENQAENIEADGISTREDLDLDEKGLLGDVELDHQTKFLLASRMRDFVDALKSKLINFASNRTALSPVTKDEMKDIVDDLMNKFNNKQNDNDKDNVPYM